MKRVFEVLVESKRHGGISATYRVAVGNNTAAMYRAVWKAEALLARDYNVPRSTVYAQEAVEKTPIDN